MERAELAIDFEECVFGAFEQHEERGVRGGAAAGELGSDASASAGDEDSASLDEASLERGVGLLWGAPDQRRGVERGGACTTFAANIWL